MIPAAAAEAAVEAYVGGEAMIELADLSIEGLEMRVVPYVERRVVPYVAHEVAIVENVVNEVVQAAGQVIPYIGSAATTVSAVYEAGVKAVEYFDRWERWIHDQYEKRHKDHDPQHHPHKKDKPDDERKRKKRKKPEKKHKKKPSIPDKPNAPGMTSFNSDMKSIELVPYLVPKKHCKNSYIDKAMKEKLSNWVTIYNEWKTELTFNPGEQAWYMLGGWTRTSASGTQSHEDNEIAGYGTLNSLSMLQTFVKEIVAAGLYAYDYPTYATGAGTTLDISDPADAHALVALKNQRLMISVVNKGARHCMFTLYILQSTDGEHYRGDTTWSDNIALQNGWQEKWYDQVGGPAALYGNSQSVMTTYSDNSYLQEHYKVLKVYPMCISGSQEIHLDVILPYPQVHSLKHWLESVPFIGGGATAEYAWKTMKAGEISILVKYRGALDNALDSASGTNDYIAGNIGVNIHRRFEAATMSQESENILVDRDL